MPMSALAAAAAVTVALLLVFTALPATTRQTETQPETQSARDAEAADAQWAPLAQLIDASSHAFAAHGASFIPPQLAAEHRKWRNDARRLMRAFGLDFHDRHPHDARRWKWFVATLNQPPEYAPDDPAGAEWGEHYRRIKARFDEDPQVTAKQRIEVYDLAEFRPRFRRDMVAARAGEAVDWSAWQAELLAVGASAPGHASYTLRRLGKSVLEATQRWAPHSLPAFREALEAGPNPTLREMVAAFDALAQARVTPMQLRFTAVDGREVDLERLRDRVVLIEFWAATWCAWCRVETPVLVELHDRYHDQGFEIVGITLENSPGDRDYLLRYLERNGIAWPQYFDGRGMENPFARRFGIVAVPQYLLLDRNGLLVWDRASGGGIRNLEARVREQLGLDPLAEGEWIEMPVEYRR
jgi:thiol-disulfide isomerase/thioredoxin